MFSFKRFFHCEKHPEPVEGCGLGELASFDTNLQFVLRMLVEIIRWLVTLCCDW
jgi:hypothetical protein